MSVKNEQAVFKLQACVRYEEKCQTSKLLFDITQVIQFVATMVPHINLKLTGFAKMRVTFSSSLYPLPTARK